MKLANFKRLIRTDFSKEFQGLVDQLASSLNSTIENLVNAFSNNISLQDNIKCTVKTLTIVVDSNNNPTNTAVFSVGFGTKPIGTICISAINQTNSSSYSTNGITVNTSYSQGNLTINNITGLIPGDTYQVTLVAFG